MSSSLPPPEAPPALVFALELLALP